MTKSKPADTAFREAARHLPSFASAVLAALDSDGAPFAVRARAHAEDGLIRVDASPALDLREAAASVLCISYDVRLWHQKSLLVRGQLLRADGGWALRGEQFLPGEGLQPFPRQLRRFRRDARSYLDMHGLPRPRVDWHRVAELWAEAGAGPREAPVPSGLPEQAQAAVGRYIMAELVTVTRDGAPIVWPFGAFFDPAAGVFRGSSTIGTPARARRLRRDPRVALLFSNPTFADLGASAAVLYQGTAHVDDEIWAPGHDTWDDHMRIVMSHRPVGIELAQKNPLSRWLFDWYLLRIPVTVAATRALWWPDGDARKAPEPLSVPAGAAA